MSAIRRAETDADVEAWREIRVAVLPNERAATVEEIRASMQPETLYLLAERDGAVVGAGTAGRSEQAAYAFVAPRVLAQWRRRGIGTELLRALADHVAALGFGAANANAEDLGAVAFAERFGFREINRQIEQVRSIGDEPEPQVPDGIEIVSIAKHPELWRAAHDPLGRQAFEDMALDTPIEVSLEQWEREWMTWPEGTFVALAGGQVIGCAGLQPDADNPERAENALTAVRRDWRSRGVASALKRTTLACAARHGLREVYTWTQLGNEDMRRLNEHLGYVTRTESPVLRAPLPLP